MPMWKKCFKCTASQLMKAFEASVEIESNGTLRNLKYYLETSQI